MPILVLVLAWGSIAHAAPEGRGREIHGATDAFTADGVAIAWAILWAANAEDATVVMRIARDDKVHPALAVVAVDPFGGQSQVIRAPAAAPGIVDVPSPRRRYADFPRTEVKLYASATPAPAEAPALTIFYLGVPDTAPEFTTETRLRAWLDGRIARLRSSAKGNAP
jgi:hypothetical protein